MNKALICLVLTHRMKIRHPVDLVVIWSVHGCIKTVLLVFLRTVDNHLQISRILCSFLTFPFTNCANVSLPIQSLPKVQFNNAECESLIRVVLAGIRFQYFTLHFVNTLRFKLYAMLSNNRIVDLPAILFPLWWSCWFCVNLIRSNKC